MRQWTRQEYWKLYELGFFEGMRVELIGGLVVEQPARSNRDFAAIDRVRELLTERFGPGFWVRAQASLDLNDQCVPDPAIAVVIGDRHQPSQVNPGTALLIVEVSDSRLTYDRTTKASLYAAAGIADYWIVNIPDRQLEIRRNPQPDATQEFGHGYASLTTLKPGNTATPLGAPSGVVLVDRLFF